MRIALGMLQLFIALGAIPAGLMFVMDPSGASLGFPLSMLSGSIFPNYLIPGLFLLLINGIGSLMGGIFTLIKNHYAWLIAIALGAILVAWIVIQVSIIQAIHWLHWLYFALGFLEIVLGVLLRRQVKPIP